MLNNPNLADHFKLSYIKVKIDQRYKFMSPRSFNEESLNDPVVLFSSLKANAGSDCLSKLPLSQKMNVMRILVSSNTPSGASPLQIKWHVIWCEIWAHMRWMEAIGNHCINDSWPSCNQFFLDLVFAEE